MDNRNLIHPMHARDLVVSAVIVAQQGTMHTQLLEVTDVGYDTSPPGPFLTVKYRDTMTDEHGELRMKPETPILVTGIRL